MRSDMNRANQCDANITRYTGNIPAHHGKKSHVERGYSHPSDPNYMSGGKKMLTAAIAEGLARAEAGTHLQVVEPTMLGGLLV